jgi:hypothetical protein
LGSQSRARKPFGPSVVLRSDALTPAARQAEVLSEALLGVGVALLELPPDDALAVVRALQR